jgi:2',3'-cyclic-nucleotide 2'-phosphodiesterase (5'-nucleotidase family)
LGRLELEIQEGRVIDYKHSLIVVDENIQSEKTVQALVNEALSSYHEELSQVVGYTNNALHRNAMLEATMDNLLLQALLDHTGTQTAFSNGWRYGAPVVPGPITLNDLWNIIPVNPPISIVELTGEEIRAMLEENLEHAFSDDPYLQMGGYVKRMLGVNVYLKIENPAGQRIQELFVYGQPVKANQVYSAAFVTAQGIPNKYGINRQDLDIHAIDALRQYLARKSPIDVTLRKSVMAI